MAKISIIGSGGFAREIACLCLDCGYDVEAFYDQIAGPWLNNIPILSLDQHNPTNPTIIAVGNPALRRKIVDELPPNTNYCTLIHPTVVKSPWVSIGRGSVVCAGSILTCNIKLGDFAQLNLGTTIGHDVTTGDFFTTAPGVHVSGNVNAGHNVYLGTNSSIIEKINIADNVTIGANACVVKDLTQPGTYVGIPAKKLNK